MEKCGACQLYGISMVEKMIIEPTHSANLNSSMFTKYRLSAWMATYFVKEKILSSIPYPSRLKII